MRRTAVFFMLLSILVARPSVKFGPQIKFASGIGAELNVFLDESFFLSFSGSYLLLLSSISGGGGFIFSERTHFLLRYHVLDVSTVLLGLPAANKLSGPEFIFRKKLSKKMFFDLGVILLRESREQVFSRESKDRESSINVFPNIGLVFLF